MPFNQSVANIANNDYVVAITGLIVVLYAWRSQIDVPDEVRRLFKNDIFRIVFLSLLVLVSSKTAPHVALAVAIIFVLTLHFINRQEMRENFIQIERFKNSKRVNK